MRRTSFCPIHRAALFISLLVVTLLSTLDYVAPRVVHSKYGDKWVVIGGELQLTTAMAWGDWDADGDLDLALGSAVTYLEHPRTRVLENVNGQLLLDPANDLGWITPSTECTDHLAWGDWDNDGDLDLASGGCGYFGVKVFENDGTTLRFEPENKYGWQEPLPSAPGAVAWGDWDDDGDLDLAVGGNTGDRAARVLENDGESLRLRPDLGWGWINTDPTIGGDPAWADWDNDGDEDLAVGLTVLEYDGNTLRLDPTEDLGWQAPGSSNYTSPSWADWENDGDFDLIAGLQVFEHDGSSLNFDLNRGQGWKYTSAGSSYVSGVWIDWDNDGDLDYSTGEKVEELDQGALRFDPAAGWGWQPVSEWYVSGAHAWGDVDQDGDLDLAVALHNEPNRLYYNHSTILTHDTSLDQGQFLPNGDFAWGDWNSDGDLDLAVGGNGISLLENYNKQLRFAADTQSGALREDSAIGSLIAWGDWDGDGDLDLAASSRSAAGGSYNRVYANAQGTFVLAQVLDPNIPQRRYGRTAWADYDNDGDLDLSIGTQTYQNINSSLVFDAENSFGVIDLEEYSPLVAWGDFDNDGDVDLAASDKLPNNYSFTEPHRNRSIRVYENDNGSLRLNQVQGFGWIAPEDHGAGPIAWGDFDSDGDLDLAAAGGRTGHVYDASIVIRVYENIDESLHFNPTNGVGWRSDRSQLVNDLDWGDIEGDGDLDLFVANTATEGIDGSRLYKNTGADLVSQNEDNGVDFDAFLSAQSASWADYDRDGDLDIAAAGALFINLVRQRTSQGAPPARAVIHPIVTTAEGSGYFSPETVTTSPVDITYTVQRREPGTVSRVIGYYSTNGGGSWTPTVPTVDTVVSRVPVNQRLTYRWDVLANGFFGQSASVLFRLDVIDAGRLAQYGKTTAYSQQFRLRSLQARVLKATQPVTGAVVFRLPAGQARGAMLLVPSHLRTDGQGYLLGRGRIAFGDQLVALEPAIITDTYTLYHSSATPTQAGLNMHRVTNPGVQVLEVSSANPLLALNLDISLEWDASNDTRYRAQLDADLRRTAELLFDWTNGQATLGRIRVFYNRENWDDAHIRIYATNRMRPNATLGGIVQPGEEVIDPDQPALTYTAGQVRMGATWNRYGEASGSLGEDWPRTLAHELGHYAFFLDDNYLGLSTGLLTNVKTCPGAMSDPYREDYTEFHPVEGWLPRCAATLSQQISGRADWATITRFYPWLRQPDGPFESINPGPNTLPIELISIEHTPVADSAAIDTPIVVTTNHDGSRYVSGPGARAVLFTSGHLVDLGQPSGDHLLARGAQPGDRLCIYDLAGGALGCDELHASNLQVTLRPVANWRPDIAVTPVTSTTLALAVTNVQPGLHLQAQVYPAIGASSAPFSLTQSATNYGGSIQLAEPTFEGAVHVWVKGETPRREIVVDFLTGGNPGRKWARRAPRGAPGRKWARRAPTISADGQATLFSDELAFAEGQFVTLQSVTAPPPPPPWSKLVGRAYRLTASPEAPSLTGSSISLSYLATDVPPGEEEWLRLAFWDGRSWTPLRTETDTAENTAVAPALGPGIYALLSSLEIELPRAGWNLVAFPVAGKRPVVEALHSVNDAYTTVYGFDSRDQADPWKIYDRDVPAYVNDLTDLRFGQGYWIRATRPVTWQLRGPESGALSVQEPPFHAGPPATFYGPVYSSASNRVGVGTTIRALIGGYTCAEGQVKESQGTLVYALNVPASASGNNHCNTARTVQLQLGNRVVASVAWRNERPIYLPLESQWRIALPLLRR